jgi:hypothetical protein
MTPARMLHLARFGIDGACVNGTPMVFRRSLLVGASGCAGPGSRREAPRARTPALFRSLTGDPGFVDVDVGGIEGDHVGAITGSELAKRCVEAEKARRLGGREA